MTTTWPVTDPNLMILTSREAILNLAPVLQTLAERTGQPGAMHWLSYFLDKGVAGRRIPYLVLLLKPEEHQGSSLSADELEAAALFFEYRICGIGTGAFTTGDATGFNSVIAPFGDRTEVAAIALRALLGRGAKVVLATYEGHRAAQPSEVIAGLPGLQAASRQRHVGRSMKLRSTFEDTLAQMGKHTRANLRYYRRRLEKIAPLTFLPDAIPLLAGADLQELQKVNAAALNPVPFSEFQRRLRSCADLPGSFLCGLQGPEGQWLSLIGGWRQGGLTVLHWQMNTAGYEKHSIGTVMRSFFIEAEIALGARELLIHGGTPHSMHHAFEQQPIADLIVRRTGWQSFALRALAPLFATSKGLLGRGNFFADTLLDREIQWVPGPSGKRSDLVMPQTKAFQISGLGVVSSEARDLA